MKLFEVCFKNYSRLYVEANGYDEAVNKALEYRKFDRETNNLLTEDGSLKKEEDDEVKEVRVASDFIVR